MRFHVLLVGVLITSVVGSGSAESVLDGATRFRSPVDAVLAVDGSGAALDAEASPQPSGGSPKVRAMVLSALIPGLGQFVYGDKSWAYFFFGVEGAIWISYAGLQYQGSQREQRYRQFAEVWGGVQDASGQDDSYYSTMGRFMSYEDYRVIAVRDPEADLYPEEQHWAWPSDERRNRYLDLRAAANDSYHTADFLIAAALLNRALSVIQAARSVHSPQSLQFQVVPERDGLTPMVSWRTKF